MSDIDTEAVDRLKVLTRYRPIREADETRDVAHFGSDQGRESDDLGACSPVSTVRGSISFDRSFSSPSVVWKNRSFQRDSQ